ncbi:hypothetical protein [Brevibacterium casei]|uniref:hypothetical protein n=1 Tax=Brevibacterium casei TaxID=33889 RepID=UPI00223AFD38|nr:hypothetical protein [Brevibacterium casei]MCT1550462.1 hypothetical protein [Brevibacterium casei]MCT1559126.1 hypothetical protein [Brevibacterium casei]MCT2206983.1 hypothetical protein [Brevibacterium casei]
MIFIETEPLAPAGRFAEWIPDATILRPFAGDPLPDRIEEPLIVFGCALERGGDETMPWLPQVRDLLVQAVEDSILTLAIGLGAQQLALATGGKVTTPKKTLETFGWRADIGHISLEKTPVGETDPLVAALGVDLNSIGAGWHDRRVRPKDGVKVFTHSPVNPSTHAQVFRVGSAAWGVTFHPEATVDEVVQWLTIFAPETSDVEFRLREGGVRMFLPRITESSRQLAESFAALAAQGPRLDSTAIISQEEADRAAEAKAASALDTLAGELLAPAAATERMRALAVLDAICTSARPRYTCTSTDGVTIARLDDGGGDWFGIAQTADGVLLRAFDHESPMNIAETGAVWPGLLEGLPPALHPWTESQEFGDDPGEPYITLALWSTGETWQHGAPRVREGIRPEETDWVIGSVKAARTEADIAEDFGYYYDLELTTDDIAPILAGTPLTPAMAAQIRTDADWDHVREVAERAGYPIA